MSAFRVTPVYRNMGVLMSTRLHRSTNTVARRMATVMVDRLTAGRATTAADLVAAGFTELQILEHKGDALRMAEQQARERGLDLLDAA